MVNSTIGNLNTFDATNEKCGAYTKRLEHFVIANGIDADKEEKRLVSVFLAVFGSTTNDLLRNLVDPHEPAEFKYKKLVKV